MAIHENSLVLFPYYSYCTLVFQQQDTPFDVTDLGR